MAPTKLAGTDRSAALATVPSWKEQANRDAIEKKYEFSNFVEAFEFMTRVSVVAEEMCHHPEWFNVYNRVEVVLSTHDCGGLSMNDINLAKRMDELAAHVSKPASSGEPIPADHVLRVMEGDSVKQVKSGEVFSGKTVVMFGLPGAFTPTCSHKHLPGFLEKYDQLKGKGVDTIVCISTNDAFVMDAWARDRNCVGKIMMLADGNGTFLNALGLTSDKSVHGMGTRCSRFALVAKNNLISYIGIEEGKDLTASGVDAVLANL
eukprot:Rmarinus@m.25936